MKNLGDSVLLALVSTLPFYYLSAFIPLNQKNIIKTDLIKTAMVSRVANPILEFSALPNKPIISMSTSLQDNILSSPQPGRVVFAGLQPKMTITPFRSPSYRARSPLSFRSYTETYTLTMMESRTIVAVSNGNIVRMTTSLKHSDIQVSKRYLLALPEYKTMKVEGNVYKFLEMVSSSSRLEPLTKIINFQEWAESKEGIPILIFNADGTHGRYKHNKGITKAINNVIIDFVINNPGLDFLLEYRSGEAEHPNQKNQLESLLLTQREAGTYQLGGTAHKKKTSDLNNIMPSTIKTIPEWFIYNGDQTIDYLEKLWNEGHLTDSVESFEMFKDAIRNCIQLDIDNFRKSGLPDTAIEFPGQIRAMAVGANDCARFNRLILTSDWDTVDKSKVEAFVKRLLTKAQVRAAYIHKGMHMFPQDSRAHQAQLCDSETFIHNFTRLMNTLQKKLPHLQHDASFQNNLDNFKKVIDGQGPFKSIVKGKAYKTFLEDLRNPKSQMNLFSRSGKFSFES